MRRNESYIAANRLVHNSPFYKSIQKLFVNQLLIPNRLWDVEAVEREHQMGVRATVGAAPEGVTA